jgi:hypothetical protein
MASTKMFVHYPGTVDAFKALPNIAEYEKKIVFIKGGTDGKGAAIYTHGSYFANFAEFIDTYVRALNYVKGVNVKGQNYNAAQGGGYLAFNASDPATVDVNAGQNGISIGLNKTFVDRVSAVETLAGNTSTALGAKGDSADAAGSAFARIAKLAEDLAALTGEGSGSVSDQIAALKLAIEGDLSDTTDSKTLEAINDELNAIDAKWSSYVSKDELSKIGDTKDHGTDVNVSVTTLGGKVTEVKVTETGLTNKLNGKANVGDSYLKAETYTKAEVTAEAERLIKILADGAVKANADAIATLQGNDKTKSIREVAIEELAKIINDDNNDDAVNTLEEIAAWIAAHPESVAAINKQIADLEKLVGTTSVESQINTKISGLNKTDDAVEGKYVSAVSEANGVISVTRADLPTYTLVEGTANGTVKFNGTEVKVHGLGSAAYTDASAYATAAQGGKADSALQSIEKGTDGAYVTTTVGNKASNKQSVAVSVTVKKVADATASGQGLADAYEAKVYADAAQSAAQAYADSLFAWEEL